MNWKNYISDVLRLSGMTQVQLALELKCGQATIADILAGRTASPRSELSFPLLLLGRKHGLTDPLQESATAPKVA